MTGLREMGERAEEMVRIALDAFAERDVAKARDLVDLDELIDRTNRRVTDHVLDLGPEIELNPVLVHYLASEHGITLDTDALEALATEGPAFDPYPVYAALAQA